MVEGGSLENYLGSDVYGGSNPSLSATNPEKSGFFCFGQERLIQTAESFAPLL